MLVHDAPKSSVRYTYGSKLPTWWASTVMYALPASHFEASMLRTTPSTGMSGTFAVTSVQLAPPSLVRWIIPSLVPAQITPSVTGLSSIA